MRENLIRVLLVALSLTVIVSAGYLRNPAVFKEDGDTRYSIAMAEGHIEGVPLHHAKRVLHPWVVGKIGLFTGADAAFVIVGTFSLFFFLIFLLKFLIYDIRHTLTASVAIIFLPLLFWLYHDLYLQPLFFVFICSVYGFSLLRKKYLLSIFFLLLLILTRDEAVIIALAFVAALLFGISASAKKKFYCFYIISTFLILGIGLSFLNNLTRDNSNVHRMPNLLFQVLRFPAYALENFTGLKHWLSTYLNHPDYTHPPIFTLKAPDWLRRYSLINRIGIYEFDIRLPFQSAIVLLSIFGTFPALLIYFFRNKLVALDREAVGFNALLFSGAALFIISPRLSSMGWRYCINAWPIFFLASPILLKQVKELDKNKFRKILLCCLFSAWLSFFYHPSALAGLILLVIAESVLYLYTWRELASLPSKGLLTVLTR